MAKRTVPSIEGADATTAAFDTPWGSVPRVARRALLIGARAVASFFRHDGLSWSAAMAFWLVLSLPPLLIAVNSVASAVLGQEAARSILLDQMASQLPAEGEMIRGILDQEVRLLSPAGAASLLLLLFAGSRVFAALVTAVNAMWTSVPDEGFVRRQGLRIVLVVTVGAMLVSSVLLQMGIMGAHEEIGPAADVLARYVLPFALLVGGLFLTYRLLPWHLASTRTALAGAIVAAALLRVAQVVFSFLLNEVVDFSAAYGSLTGVAVLMTWAVVASGVVLLGAEIVATVDPRRADAEA